MSEKPTLGKMMPPKSISRARKGVSFSAFARFQSATISSSSSTTTAAVSSSSEESDSLVNIQREESEATERRVLKETRPQPEKIAEAHEMAAKAADAAEGDACTSESIETAANKARIAAGPTIPSMSVGGRKRLRPPAIDRMKMVPVGNVYNPTTTSVKNEEDEGESEHESVPLERMSVRKSYEMMNNYVQRSVETPYAADGSTVTAPSGRLGSRVAECTSKLVRDMNKRRPYEPMLPRAISSSMNPMDDTFLRYALFCGSTDQRPPHINPVDEDKMRKTIIVSTRAHEESMMRAATPNDQACSQGTNCIGNRLLCYGGGETLIAFFFQHEWAKYQDDLKNGKDARLPDTSRLCILCRRNSVSRFIINLKAEKLAVRSDCTMISDYCNLCDVPGEYCMADMIRPNDKVYEGILEPVVKLSLRMFARVIDKETNNIYFQQTLPYPEDRCKHPVAGEIQHF